MPTDVTRVITTPGPEYADEARRWQGIPGLERAASGRLWATWYSGGVTEDRHNYVLVATSADDGATWSRAKFVIDPDGPGPVRAFDPCLWHDPLGRLWLFWNQKLCNLAKDLNDEQERSWRLWAMRAEDSSREDTAWSPPEIIGEAIMMNKPTVLSTGEWLLCSSDWFWDRSARVFRSADQGRRWEVWGSAHVPEKVDRSFDEHMVVERRDGSLWMLIRTKYGIGESLSADRGRSWSYVKPSAIANVNARFFIRRLRSGELLLVKHGAAIGEKPEKRSHLCAFLSPDDGRTWEGGLMLDERLAVSYPDGVEAPDGTIYLIHDFERYGAKEILLSRITTADIRAKQLQSPRSALRLLINKAFGARGI
jgi:hypothetical protein